MTVPPEPVHWLSDGSPHSPRFNDRYRSCTGGFTQAETVFLHECGLPDGWRGQSDFTILKTGFGLGVNFLATWASWDADEHQSDRLHSYSIEPLHISVSVSPPYSVPVDDGDRVSGAKHSAAQLDRLLGKEQAGGVA